jgi:hypothetical protein
MFLKKVIHNIPAFLATHSGFVNPDKKKLIDYVFGRFTFPASFADLGGVWNVDGAYTFYTLSKYKTEYAFLVDTDFTETVIRKGKRSASLKLIHGNFGEESVAAQIGRVNVIFLFDVLLHQVDPDWDQILEIYSRRTDYFVIYNQQWIGSESSVRLLDLGKEEYFRNIPHGKDDQLYKDLFDKIKEIHPGHKKIWRDIHNVWQWGITDRDLTGKMENLGYKMLWHRNYGRFGSLINFENHGFVFKKI